MAAMARPLGLRRGVDALIVDRGRVGAGVEQRLHHLGQPVLGRPWSGVQPCRWTAFTSAPAAISASATPDWLPATALWSGRTRISLRATASGSAPASNNSRATASPPKKAAKWSAVNPSADQRMGLGRIGSKPAGERLGAPERGRLEDVHRLVGQEHRLDRRTVPAIPRDHHHRHATGVRRVEQLPARPSTSAWTVDRSPSSSATNT